jgi:hypothetical protein
MSKAIVGESLAEMSEGQQLEAVPDDPLTLKQLDDVDDSPELRRAYRDFLVQTEPKSAAPVVTEAKREVDKTGAPIKERVRRQQVHKGGRRTPARLVKQRFGLPKDFVPRLQRFGGSVLLERNVYRLADGREFIPTRPVGTLGARQHMYALLTSEQYLKGKRGSVYVRSDGRIFDYSVDTANPIGDFFDTGYTIYDLQRTGRYAPEPGKKSKRAPTLKYRGAAAAGSPG